LLGAIILIAPVPTLRPECVLSRSWWLVQELGLALLVGRLRGGSSLFGSSARLVIAQ
jgi:hypothetical protein